jgi:hypothetical protein
LSATSSEVWQVRSTVAKLSIAAGISNRREFGAALRSVRKSDGPALWCRLRRRSRLRSHLAGKLTGAWQARLVGSTPWEPMAWEPDCESRGRLCGVGASLSIYAGIWLAGDLTAPRKLVGLPMASRAAFCLSQDGPPFPHESISSKTRPDPVIRGWTKPEAGIHLPMSPSRSTFLCPMALDSSER